MLVLIAVGSGQLPVYAFGITSWHDLRWEGVHRQQTDVSCGPATVVTLLQTYFGIAVEEATVYALATRVKEVDESVADLYGIDPSLIEWRATTLGGLGRAMQFFGFETVGLNMDAAQMRRYFEDIGLPLVAHVERPTQHFLLIVGIVGDDAILIADSSRGHYIQSFSEFEKRSSGYVLAYVPPVPIQSEQLRRRLSIAAANLDFLAGLGGVKG